MTITINEKEITLKNTLRCLLMYENIAEKSFKPETLNDIVTFFYCVVISSCKDYSITFEDFMDWLDDNIAELTNFTLWMQSTSDTTEQLKKK